MNTAIIVAAGSGKRFGGDTPKQFLNIHGKPLINYTIEKFANCDSIDQIILVLSELEMGRSSQLSGQFSKLQHVISGGATRAESVYKGLDAIDSADTEIVAVHDGARPLVTEREISATVEEALRTGAACLVASVVDTIKEVSGNRIVRTVDRSQLRRALTPQSFRYEILKRAFDEYVIGEPATDECFLVERLGYEISIVEGSSENIKVTHPSDLEILEKALTKIKERNV